jgi:hypothetical protein
MGELGCHYTYACTVSNILSLSLSLSLSLMYVSVCGGYFEVKGIPLFKEIMRLICTGEERKGQKWTTREGDGSRGWVGGYLIHAVFHIYLFTVGVVRFTRPKRRWWISIKVIIDFGSCNC